MSKKTEVESIAVKSIKANSKLQHRSKTDSRAIKDWVRLLERKNFEFPAIVVYRINNQLYVVDGFHRLEAYVTAGRSTIPCIVIDGSWDEAIKYSLFQANQDNNSIRESNEDKRNKIKRVLMGKEEGLGAAASNHWIAEKLSVLRITVERVRAKLEKLGIIEFMPIRQGRDGKLYRKTQNRGHSVPPVGKGKKKDEDAAGTASESNKPKASLPNTNGRKLSAQEIRERLVQLIKQAGHQNYVIDAIVYDDSVPEVYLFRDELVARVLDDK